tara:strand:- start:783 stop:1451 length:669 start_codon:yes stop_codon:yes gene_type:complete
MASTYSSDLKLELMATGENAGTWGTKTNTNLELVQQAIAGYQAIDVASSDVALVMSNASISNARNMVLNFTGTLAANRTVTIPDSIEKFYILKDGTTHSGNTLTFKTVSGTGFTLDEGKIHAAFSDGTNITEVALDTLGGTIGTAQIADDSVNNDKMANDAIQSAQLANNAVITDKISNVNVTTAKIADNAITAAKLERKFTISTSSPSGGNDGDIWFKYST